MSAGTVDLEYRCAECEHTITEPGRGHADECETGAQERDRKRYERMHDALQCLYVAAEYGLYGKGSVRDAAEAIVRGREWSIRPGSWEADLEAEAQAKGWAIVQTGDLAVLREALDGEVARTPRFP